MRKVFLRYTMLLAALALSACGGDSKVVETSSPVNSLDDDSIDDDLNVENMGPCVENPNPKQSLVMNDGTYYQCIDGLWLRVELSSSSKRAKSSSSARRSSSSSENKKESSSSEGVSSEAEESSSSENAGVSSSESAPESSASIKSSSSHVVIDLTLEYDCSEYDCVYTGYLNSKMLGSGIYGQFLDTRDGQVYRTVKIGSQTWIAQNLNYASENSECMYDHEYYCTQTGRLYYQSDALTVCPEGWHLPSSKEWDELDNFAALELEDSTIVGNGLKSVKSWPNEVGFDLFGFSGVATVFFGETNICGGIHGSFWTSDDYEYRCLLDDWGDLRAFRQTGSVDWVMSVRCILDD
ncbi:FISUMP domain-containing protein [Fibrobacter succinogenes]|uniref:FISUMP domain-containing protein n=1 Tax=Fibrobacter succinogenes TaxID=833 RepID=UPI0013D68583|nr:FISUMP domain-containing protein [Fibrobacter succinogenes]